MGTTTRGRGRGGRGAGGRRGTRNARPPVTKDQLDAELAAYTAQVILYCCILSHFIPFKHFPVSLPWYLVCFEFSFSLTSTIIFHCRRPKEHAVPVAGSCYTAQTKKNSFL